MGSIVGGESGTDVILAGGEASWADLVWVKASKHMEGTHIASSSSVNLNIE